MKRKLRIFTAFILAASISLTGCSLHKNNSDKPSEGSSEASSAEASDDSALASSGASDDIIVAENLLEPILEEIESALGGSTESSAAASSFAEPAPKEQDRIEMVFIGDSQMANGRSDGTDLASLVSARVPNSVAYNLGIGGTTAALEESTSELSPEKWTSNCFVGIAYSLSGKSDRTKVLESNPDILETMNKIDPAKVDYYFIEYGANDFFKKTPLDTYSSPETPYVKTFYGALNTGIDELRSVSPNAQVILMTPFYGIYKDTDGNFIGDSYVVSNGIDTLANYARKVGNVVEVEECLDFDCMFMSKCDLYLDTYEEYLMDGTHLTLKGRQIFARLLAHIPNWAEGFEPYAYLETDFIKISEFDPNEYYRYNPDWMKEYYPENYERMQNGEYLLAPPQ